jgi:inorganic pyrophosphatase
LRLDRVLHSAVFGRDPIHPLTIVEVRAIGVMKMRDDKGLDDKLLAVNIGDPAFSDYRDFRELPKHVIREMSRFFQDYKVLEGKEVIVEEPLGPSEAIDVIRQALRDYQKLPVSSRGRS